MNIGQINFKKLILKEYSDFLKKKIRLTFNILKDQGYCQLVLGQLE